MSNGNNTGNNLFGDLNNTDLLYINILNTIYNDNLRIINQLLGQNSEITHSLINFMNRARPSSFTNIFNDNLNQYNNRYSTNTNTNTNTNAAASSDDRRIFIDNIPYYIVDEVQFFTIPTTNPNTEPNTEPNLDSSGNTNLNERHRRPSTIHRNALRRHYNNPNITNEVLPPTSIESRGGGFLNSFLQPIIIRPTQAQIENATCSLVYGEIIEPINTSCPISLETFTETSEVTLIKHCKHIFNKQNLMSWFNGNCKCPVCRYDIRNYINPEHDETIHDTSNTDVNVNRDQHMRNIRNITDETVNILENLFQDVLYDLSYNNLQFSFR